MKCIIVDDEPLAIDLIAAYIERMDDIEIAATTNSPIEAISLIQNTEVDLIFLDIQMPNITGLELVKAISNLPQFIFTTAYPQYALDGFELNATDYLVKPIAFPRFVKAVSRAKELHDLKSKESIENQASDEFIFVKSEYENVKINTAEILYIEGLKDYIKIHIANSNKSILTLMSFKAILEKLPKKHFLRIHRSYIVNIDHVTSHQKNKLIVDDTRIPISDAFKHETLNRLGL